MAQSTAPTTQEFIGDDFLLQGASARKLYHEVAKELPIIDYHSHLPPIDVRENRKFANLYELWLEGDHYKWRAMRANGVSEEYCTGDADPYDKFLAYCQSMPKFLRNPLYHWSHLELQRLFGIAELINEASAPRIWEQANEKLAGEDFRACGILQHFKVEVVCTTDDPVDSLEHHLAVNQSGNTLKMLPTFRPDKALGVEDPSAFAKWTQKLGDVTGKPIASFDDFLSSLDQRHENFHQAGSRLSDHGLEHAYGGVPYRECAEKVFMDALSGKAPGEEDAHAYKSFLMVHFGKLDAAKGWTKQMHLGAYRNVNSARFAELGPDKGFDSIGDYKQGRELGSYFDQLEKIGAMPKAVIYNHNPVDNYLFATLAGNFQDGKIPGKVQFGSGWWFLDQKEGMEAQINALSSLGLLSRFVGMLTDSRSFLSFPRHEYFRRILSNLIGQDMEDGMIPQDFELASSLISDVCYHNARNYFGFYED